MWAHKYKLYFFNARFFSFLFYSEEEAKFGARRLARSLQKLGFQVILMKKDLYDSSDAGSLFF